MSTDSILNPQSAVDIMRWRTVFVAGAGVAGKGIVAMLEGIGGRFKVVDDRAQAADLNTAEAIAAVSSADTAPALLITSPGWRPDSELLLATQAAGVPVIGDIEAAWLADQAGAFGTPRTWIAITGTNGKTTATAMTTAMLQAAGLAAVSVGNIGTPPGAALVADERAYYLVAEVSSFQLHWAPSFTPDTGVVLNLAEDHLDWHGSMAGYAGDKLRALRGPRPVVAVDEQLVRELAEDNGVPNVVACSLQNPAEVLAQAHFPLVVGVVESEAGAVITEVATTEGDELEVTPIASAEAISPPGPAGIADAVAACALVRAFDVPPVAISQALHGFEVQAHRGQAVHLEEGVIWIDNSKATNPHAAIAALGGLENIVWVAGGQLKGAEVHDLIATVGPGLRGAVVLGCDRADIIRELAAQFPDLPVTDIANTDPEGAMAEAVTAARNLAEPGDSVVLAPAAASLDMYTGMAQRGELFAAYARGTGAQASASEREGESK